jgi:cold shock protein
MPIGTIRFWNNKGGYGFATNDSGDGDVFIHVSECDDSVDELQIGQRIKFETRPSRKGDGRLEAIDVEVL